MTESSGSTSPAAEPPRLSTLKPSQFTRYLVSAVRQGPVDPAGATEIERRASANRLANKDLWLILMKSDPDDGSWIPARQAALAIAKENPGVAMQVAELQAQDSGGTKLQMETNPSISGAAGTGSPGGPVYVARAYVETRAGASRFYGPRCQNPSRKAAEHLARLAFLECQAGLAQFPALTSPVTASLVTASPVPLSHDREGTAGSSQRPGEMDGEKPGGAGPGLALDPAAEADVYGSLAADPDDTGSSPVSWRQAVSGGWAVTFAPGFLPGMAPRFLVFPPDPAAARAVDGVTDRTAPKRKLLLAGRDGTRVLREHCLPVQPFDLAVEALAGDTAFAHPSAAGWARAARLGAEMVAAGLAYPGLDKDGYPGWHLSIVPAAWAARVAEVTAGLPAHATCVPDPADARRRLPASDAVGAFLNSLASGLTASPGTRLLLGDAPFAVSDGTQPHLRDFTDRVEELLDDADVPGIVLRVSPPVRETVHGLPLTLLLHSHGHSPDSAWPAVEYWHDITLAKANALKTRVRRILRQAAQFCPCLAELARDAFPSAFLLSPESAAVLVGPAAAKLADLGMTVEWDGDWNGQLETRVVVGTGSPSPWDPDLLTVDSLLDFRWQITLDGTVLTDAEMRAIAEAQHPLLRIHDRMVLISSQVTERARHRIIRRGPARQALLRVLSGSVTIDGQDYSCTPAGGLKALLDILSEEIQTGNLVAPGRLAWPLKNHQHRALNWLARLSGLGFGMCLADEAGTGKTLTAIAFHLHRKASGCPGATLVLCPLILLRQWASEISRFAPDVPVITYHGTSRTLAGLTDDSIVLTTYQTLSMSTDDLVTDRDWGLAVADEAQELKNERTSSSCSARTITAAARLAMTGTPLENSVDELRAIMDWTNPGLFGSSSSFRRTFGRAVTGNDQETTSRLARLFGPFMLRRLKDDPAVGLGLPDKTEVTHIVPMSDAQRGLYELHARRIWTQIANGGDASRGEMTMKLMSTCRKLSNSPDHFLETSPRAFSADPAANRLSAPKLARTEEILAAARADGRAALIFTTFKVMARLLCGHLAATGFDTGLIDGEMSGRQRQMTIERFQGGEGDVLIITKKTGGVGINLTRASDVIHYEPSWNPGVEDQAADRAHRIGQRNNVTVHYLVTHGTIEQKICARLLSKRILALSILPTGEPDLSHLTNSELLDIVNLRLS